MPSLTRFVYELSTAEPYGKEVVARLDERLNSLNDSQIAGLSEHLELAAAKARSRLWREGNEAVSPTAPGLLVLSSAIVLLCGRVGGRVCKGLLPVAMVQLWIST